MHCMQMETRMVRVPVELLERIDGVRGTVPRERWIRGALEAVLVPQRVQVAASVAAPPASPRAPQPSFRNRAGGKSPDSFKPIPKGK